MHFHHIRSLCLWKVGQFLYWLQILYFNIINCNVNCKTYLQIPVIHFAPNILKKPDIFVLQSIHPQPLSCVSTPLPIKFLHTYSKHFNQDCWWWWWRRFVHTRAIWELQENCGTKENEKPFICKLDRTWRNGL